MQSPYAEQVEAQVWEYLNAGDARQAIATCERLNREFPNFASGWHTASQLALKLGNAPMALDAIREELVTASVTFIGSAVLQFRIDRRIEFELR